MKINLILIFILVQSICLGQESKILKTYSAKQLNKDYDLMVSALKEAHPGLYWYLSFNDFEKIFQQNKNKIKDGMNSYEFYRIISNVVSADKEGHSQVFSSKDIGDFIHQEAKYLPFAIKTVNEKIYLVNDIAGKDTKGKIITKINKTPIDTILSTIFENTSRYSDGYSTTGKYRNIDRFSFTGYYVDFISDLQSSKTTIELLNPKNNKLENFEINLVNRDSLVQIAKQTPRKKQKNADKLYNLEINKQIEIALLQFNNADFRDYNKAGMDFQEEMDSVFKTIETSKIKNLIIDIRNLGGSSEGFEDYVFSYLTNKPFTKYKYVEAKSNRFSFLNHSNYKDSPEELNKLLDEELYQTNDGRYLRKPDYAEVEKPKPNAFLGNLYILISGKTYSGGSEFASIVKNYRKATFIGEETGGGFYGQTSGMYINLKLPNTGISLRIPILKFATIFENKDIPFGRGVIPNYKVEQSYEDFVNGIDTEMEFAFKLIENKE